MRREERNQEKLAKYVHDALAAGRSREQIAADLRGAGWTDNEIDQALEAWKGGEAGPPVPKPTPFVSGQEMFYQSLLFAALWVSVICLIYIGWELIDYWQDRRVSINGMRTAIAWLLVAFLLFLGLNAQVSFIMAKSMNRPLVGRWFSYLTLFIAAIVIVCALISFVYRVLIADFSLAPLASTALVGAVAGAIFLYFQARARGKTTTKLISLPLLFLILLVTVGIVAGLVVASNPAQAERERRDKARVNDLEKMNGYVTCAARLADNTLPETLPADLDCENSKFRKDPSTNQPYRYEKITDQVFRLCAEFEALNKMSPRRFDIDQETGCMIQSVKPASDPNT